MYLVHFIPKDPKAIFIRKNTASPKLSYIWDEGRQPTMQFNVKKCAWDSFCQGFWGEKQLLQKVPWDIYKTLQISTSFLVKNYHFYTSYGFF